MDAKVRGNAEPKDDSEPTRASDAGAASTEAGRAVLSMLLVGLAAGAAAALALALERSLADWLGPGDAGRATALAFGAAALGAFACGAAAPRLSRPLAAVGLLVLAAAALAAVASGAGPRAAALAPGPGPWLVLWLALGPPAFFAGGAVALAARSAPRGAPPSIALGAALGLAGAGFGALPAVGADATRNVAVALALVVGVALIALGRQARARTRGTNPVPTAGPPALAPVLVGAALHFLWRLGQLELAPLAGPTARAAWAATSAFAAWLGLGLALAAGFAGRRPRGTLLCGLVLAVAGAALAHVSRAALAVRFAEVVLLRAEPARPDRWLAAAAALQASAALGAGLVLGALLREREPCGRFASRALLGGALACLALELGPLPARGALPLAATGLLALAAALGARSDGWRGRVRPLSMAAGVALVALGFVLERAPLRGPYLGREGSAPEAAVTELVRTPTGELALLGAPPRAVLRDGRPTEGDGVAEALAFLPRLLAPDARRVLIDGIGTGRLARALASLAPTEVVCAEPEPRALQLARELGPLEVEHVPSDLRTLLARDSGKAERFDLILVDASAAWPRGATARLSSELFRSAAARLARTGLVVVALATDALLTEQLGRVLETGVAVFPEAALFSGGSGLVLFVLSPSGLFPELRELDAAQRLVGAAPAVAARLVERHGTSDVRTLLLESLWADDAASRELARRLGAGRPIDDAELGFELAAFHPALMARAGLGELGARLAEHNESALTSALGFEALRLRFVEWRAGAPQLAALRAHKDRCFATGRLEDGLALVQLGLAYEPDDSELVADLLLFGLLEPADFDALLQRLLARSPREGFRLGSSLPRLGRGEQGQRVLEALVELQPESPAARLALADVYEARGQPDLAAFQRKRAAELDAEQDPVFAR